MAKNHTTSPSFFQTLRDGFAFVAQNAQHVRINEDKIEDYAKTLNALPVPDTLDDHNHFVSGDLEKDFGYILLLDSINFGSGYKPALRSEGMFMIDGSIYFTISQRLKNRFNIAPISAAEAEKMTLSDVQDIFRFPTKSAKDAPASAELSAHFKKAINELGAHVLRTGQGSYTRFIDNMEGSASRCVASLDALSMFQDTATYKGRTIGFYKRAQIAATDLHLIAEKNGVNLFKDIGDCTIFCDNAVPHVLKEDGILEYSPELSALIAEQAVIPYASDMEVEIRGCAAHAVELVSQFTDLRVIDLDHRLWHRSKEQYFRALPSHKTRTIFY